MQPDAMFWGRKTARRGRPRAGAARASWSTVAAKIKKAEQALSCVCLAAAFQKIHLSTFGKLGKLMYKSCFPDSPETRVFGCNRADSPRGQELAAPGVAALLGWDTLSRPPGRHQAHRTRSLAPAGTHEDTLGKTRAAREAAAKSAPEKASSVC